MSRYKGRSSAKAIERDFPHIVEMAVPLGGFGRRLDDIHEWHPLVASRPAAGKGGMRMIGITFAGALLIHTWLPPCR